MGVAMLTDRWQSLVIAFLDSDTTVCGLLKVHITV